MLPRVLALLLQRYAHLLRTDRIDVVVKLQHLVLHRRRRIRVGSPLGCAPPSPRQARASARRTLPAGAYAFTALSIVKKDAVGSPSLQPRPRATQRDYDVAVGTCAR